MTKEIRSLEHERDAAHKAMRISEWYRLEQLIAVRKMQALDAEVASWQAIDTQYRGECLCSK